MTWLDYLLFAGMLADAYLLGLIVGAETILRRVRLAR